MTFPGTSFFTLKGMRFSDTLRIKGTGE